MTQVIYTPGVCNIGPAEITRRRTVGWIGLAVTIAVLALLLIVQAPAILRLVIFLPAFAMAAGFVQAQMGFCVAFAQSGVYNLDAVGTTQSVTNDGISKAKDVKHAATLYVYMVIIAVLVTVFAFLI
jgi:hypothetical protein